MQQQYMIHNPIIPGFYPDPSICRVENDFYLINSSFALFPGIPIFHSTDLAHWEQIGNVLERVSQLHLDTKSLLGGIMAPTLRYHDGTFYVITSNFCDKGNFIVKAADPRGPWSDPVWLPDFPGIDPSLFFDDDGRVYLTGTRTDRNPDGTEQQAIWARELDLGKMRVFGDAPTLWTGAMQNAVFPEGPHLYKKDGYYYLMIAEGGTEHFHAVMIARSRRVFGPYEGYKGNPVMTHRHLGKNYPICNTGHADLVELKDGSWYAVMLASRLVGGYHKNLGRETFITPVIWEDGWPVFSPGTGRIEREYPAPDLPQFTPKTVAERDDFDDEKLDMQWVCFGTPYEKFYHIKDSVLTLNLTPAAMSPELKPINTGNSDTSQKSMCPSFLGKRQRHVNFKVKTKMRFCAEAENETAGLVVMQANNHQFRLERALNHEKQVIRLIQVTCEFMSFPHLPDFKSKTTERELACKEVSGSELVLEITAHGQAHSFYYGVDEKHMRPLFENADGRLINPEKVGGMVGTVIGIFASSNGKPSRNAADFDWFLYSGSDDSQQK